jgi:hypothetical protein
VHAIYLRQLELATSEHPDWSAAEHQREAERRTRRLVGVDLWSLYRNALAAEKQRAGSRAANRSRAAAPHTDTASR